MSALKNEKLIYKNHLTIFLHQPFGLDGDFSSFPVAFLKYRNIPFI